MQIYSRNSENMTEKYPDVIQATEESLFKRAGATPKSTPSPGFA